MAAVGIATALAPPIVVPAPAKVYVPVPAVNVALLEMLPFTVTALLLELLKVPPLLTVRRRRCRSRRRRYGAFRSGWSLR